MPAFDELWTAHDEVNHHYRRYRLRDLEALVRGSGLAIVESRYFFVWVALVKWLVARKERVIRPVVKPPDVPAAPRQRGRARADTARTARRWATATRRSAAPRSWSRALRADSRPTSGAASPWDGG